MTVGDFRTMSVLVMTPTITPSGLHTTTRLMWVLDNSFAASVRRASFQIVIRRWSAIGSILSTNTAALFHGSSFQSSKSQP